VDSARQSYLYLHILRRVVAYARDFQFAFAGGVLYGGHYGLGGGAERQFPYDNAFRVACVKLGAQQHFAVAVVIFGDIGQSAGGEVGED